MSTFAIGDRVEVIDPNGCELANLGDLATVTEVEPNSFDGESLITARSDDGRSYCMFGSRFKAVEPDLVPVGTRVTVDYAYCAEEHHGKPGTVTSNTEAWSGFGGGTDPHTYRVRLDESHLCSPDIYVRDVTPIIAPSREELITAAGGEVADANPVAAIFTEALATMRAVMEEVFDAAETDTPPPLPRVEDLPLSYIREVVQYVKTLAE